MYQALTHLFRILVDVERQRFIGKRRKLAIAEDVTNTYEAKPPI